MGSQADNQADNQPEKRQVLRPTCMIVDDDPAIRLTLRRILGNRQVGSPEIGSADWRTAGDVAEACMRAAPDVLFLDLAMRGFDAIDVIRALGERHYGGAIVLISGLHAVMQNVMRVGERHGLVMLPPLPKPFRAHQVEEILRDFRGHPPPAAVA
jgi:CheY-like chemotaxis protein